MYDDYDLDYTYSNDYGQDLDEYARDADIDEEYTRDGQDYETLAYRHYAWYNRVHMHETLMIAQKRLVQVTLDIMCYDDLNVEDMDWKELLELEGDEEVYSRVKEYDPFL